jgi:hypothetical protein
MGPGPSWAEALRVRANSSVVGSMNEKDIFTGRLSRFLDAANVVWV